MFQPRLLAPLRALERGLTRAPTAATTAIRNNNTSSLLRNTSSILSATSNSSILTQSKLTPLVSPTLHQFLQVRHASHASQGTANRHSRDPAGKRLGAKRTAGEYVVPGCIIFRQRGTKWFPGENCAMGRDHTIYAAEAGYVRYYLDPERHPDRKYIGVVFEKDGKLPTPKNAPTRRKLNRVAVRFEPEEEVAAKQGDLVAKIGEDGTQVGSATKVEAAQAAVQLRPGYMYREANWSIGRAAEKAGITAKPYNRKNRWLAWRKRTAKADRLAQMKSLKNKKKKKGGK
ncbi:mitochondrial 54S ribosomal protein bL27m [Aspergillus tubingensis]|uniref:mitochondrial 54S ribosomal protein bL27m n=1 Tax=Aspergillus tubingensis TaxID=5068 RepID=UPI001578DFA9|nr:50S ribosomal protein L27 [Aspergillus tubingensis]GFN21106.1 50S ribosomal protein L27 [Aspergillus tubingensis]